MGAPATRVNGQSLNEGSVVESSFSPLHPNRVIFLLVAKGDGVLNGAPTYDGTLRIV